MQDHTHSHLQFKVTAIIDDALAELMLLDSTMTRDGAAFLMAVQGCVRIEDNEKMKELEKFVYDSIWDYDDTGGDK